MRVGNANGHMWTAACNESKLELKKRRCRLSYTAMDLTLVLRHTFVWEHVRRRRHIDTFANANHVSNDAFTVDLPVVREDDVYCIFRSNLR